MEKTKQILIENEKNFPELFEQIKYINDIENSSLEPHRKIGRLKCLFEGIFKNILNKIDENFKKDNRIYSSTSIHKLFQITYSQLEKMNNTLGKEIDYFSGFKSLIESINSLRNDFDTDGHGRVLADQKNISIDENLCKIFIDMADPLLFYVLEKYFETELGYLIYDENQSFNDYLDDENTTNVKNVLYSKLLYENDYSSYEQRFDTWIEYQAEAAEDCYLDQAENWR
jgi:hypothetical protein